MAIHLSGAEQQIMRQIWAAGRPLTCEELRQRLAGEREWKTTTVLTFLARLTEKGMLCVTKQGRANLYAARISEAAYEGEESARFLEEMHGGSVKRMIAALCESGRIEPGELEELCGWLEARRQRDEG